MGVILMIMTIGGLIVAAILLIVARATKKSWLKHFVFGGLTTWFIAYAFLLFCGSFFSEEQTLSFNEPKEFCGFYFDCHMHTAVTNVRKSKTIGDKAANGEFYIVRVKVFSNAKEATLGLIGVDAKAVDAQNKIYERDTQAEAGLGEQPPFDKQISPVESFEKEIVFDLPSDVKNPRLDVAEGIGIDKVIESVLIGDEDSLFHKRIRFNLESQPTQAGLN